MNAPRAIIAEDEPVLREELAEHLARLWPELQVVAKVEDGVKALRAVEDHRPDVAFLDIQMPGLSGFDVARQLAGRCHVAFVTAFDGHAVQAFEQGAVDYVMKPFTAGRLMTTVMRLREKYSTAPPDLTGVLARLGSQAAGARSYLRWINVSRGGAVRIITVEDILYFRSDSKYTLVVTRDMGGHVRLRLKDRSEALAVSETYAHLFRQM